jgi:hypothetical protein
MVTDILPNPHLTSGILEPLLIPLLSNVSSWLSREQNLRKLRMSAIL